MNERCIRVLLTAQRLELLEGDRIVLQFPVSTSKYGVGESIGSERTPRGRHEIAKKIGGSERNGAVFIGREPTGEICTPELMKAQPGRDWIISRILWLRGLEEGFNLGGAVDTESRYIYIHGTPEEDQIKYPSSHGCIRMRSDDVIELFELVDIGTRVDIVE
jgi:hypothetical protein